MNSWAILALLATVLLLGIAGFLILTKPEPLSVSLNITLPSPVVLAGQDILASFTIHSNRKTTVTLNYSIISRTGRHIMFDQDTISFDGTSTKTIPLHIPEETSPGPHWLRAHVFGESTSTTSIIAIVISPPRPKPKEPLPSRPTPEPTKPRQRTPISPPLIIFPTPQSSVIPTPLSTPPTSPESSTPPQPPTPLLPQDTPLQNQPASPAADSTPKPIPTSPDEIRAKLLTKAPHDPSGAAQDCTSLPPGEQDNCYSDVALAAKTSTICQRISDTSTKDACLANLALNGDFSVCESILNVDIKDSCIALRGKTP